MPSCICVCMEFVLQHREMSQNSTLQGQCLQLICLPVQLKCLLTCTQTTARLGLQGAFILVGNNQFGYPLLIVMALTVYMYACWRFWEGITGQGSDDAFGKFKNFFKYRLSPLVSVSKISTACVHMF